MATARLILEMRSMMPGMVKLGWTGTKSLDSFRAGGGRIASTTFWRNWNEIKSFVINVKKNKERNPRKRLLEEDFVTRATSTGKKYQYRFETKTMNGFTGKQEDRILTVTSSRRMSAQTALQHLQDNIETFGSGETIEIISGEFIGGLKKRPK